jgi:hypothetical protein
MYIICPFYREAVYGLLTHSVTLHVLNVSLIWLSQPDSEQLQKNVMLPYYKARVLYRVEQAYASTCRTHLLSVHYALSLPYKRLLRKHKQLHKIYVPMPSSSAEWSRQFSEAKSDCTFFSPHFIYVF